MGALSAFQTSLLPLSAVNLGRFTRNTKAPHEEYHDPLTLSTPEFIKNVQKNFEELRSSSSAFRLRGRLTQLLSASYESSRSKKVDLSAAQAYTYSMCNHGTYFKSVCALPDVRRFLQDAIEDGDDVYLVVGYHTVVDARFGTGRTASATDKEGVSMPIDATGLPSVQGMDMTAGVDTTHKYTRMFTRTFDAPGEQVYAVQFRKVAFKWFSNHKVDKGVLKDNMWRVYAGRGDEEDDVVEAVLDGDEDEGIDMNGESGEVYEKDEEFDEQDPEETWTGDDGDVWIL